MKKSHFYLISCLSVLLLFQNCGQEYASSSLYGGGYERLGREDCISDVVDCGPQVDFLQISIDTPNPLALASGLSFYLVAGRCNVGNYPEHYIRYEVKNSTGTIRIAQNLSEICDSGRYEFTLVLSGLTVNERHTLSVVIVGIDEEGNSFSNMQSGGSATVDLYRM